MGFVNSSYITSLAVFLGNSSLLVTGKQFNFRSFRKFITAVSNDLNKFENLWTLLTFANYNYVMCYLYVSFIQGETSLILDHTIKKIMSAYLVCYIYL